MNRFQTNSLLIVACCAVLSMTAKPAASDTFGSGANTFDIRFVNIGKPGNVADTTGDPSPAGSVAEPFRIGKYEISEQMVDKANALGELFITQDPRGPDKPASSISWNEAARFVNWLNTSTGNAPAYKFALQPGEGGYNANADIQLWVSDDAGYNPNNRFRNSQAKYFLPSADEWYKAAYYDPISGVYYNYPTGSDTVPTAIASGTAAGTAVYRHFPDAGPAGPADVTQAGGLSPYGTMGQGGNALEWQESTPGRSNNSSSSLRILRGGTFDAFPDDLSTSNWGGELPSEWGTSWGFRVASRSNVPEPSALVLAAPALFLARLPRHRRRFH